MKRKRRFSPPVGVEAVELPTSLAHWKCKKCGLGWRLVPSIGAEFGHGMRCNRRLDRCPRCQSVRIRLVKAKYV